MRKKAISYIMIFLLVSGLVLGIFNDGTIVKADFITFEDWDDGYNIGEESGTGTYIEFTKISEDANVEFKIINDYVVSSPYCLEITDDHDVDGTHIAGYINLTNTYQYISGIELNFDFVGTISGDGSSIYDVELTFFNSVDTEVLKIELYKSYQKSDSQPAYADYRFYYYDYDSVRTLGDNVDGEDEEYSSAMKLVIRHEYDNLMNYSWYNSSGGLMGDYVEDSCKTVASWETFSYIKIEITNDDASDPYHSNAGIYLDDFKIDTATSQGGDSGDDENPTWDYVGEVGTGIYTSEYSTSNFPASKYMEKRRNVIMNCEVKEFWLQFDITQSTHTITDLDFYLNGESLGMPDEIATLSGAYDSFKVAKWKNINQLVDGTTFKYEFRSTHYDSGAYWSGIGVGGYDVDLDNDGKINIGWHNVSEFYGNGVVDSTVNYVNYDLAYRLYYVGFGSNLENSLSLDTNTVELYDSVNAYYTASLEYDTYLTVTNTTDVEIFNITVTDADGWETITPISDSWLGENNFSLYTNGVWINETVTVTSAPDEDWGIWVSNNRALPFETVTVYYKVPTGSFGAIRISSDDTIPAIYESIDVEGSTSTGTLSYTFVDDDATFLFELYKLSSGTYYFKDDETVVVSAITWNDYLIVSPTIIELGEKVRLYGSHNYIGLNVFLLINETGETFDISDSGEYQLYYIPQELGSYTVDLMLNDIEVDTVTFSVIQPATDESGGWNGLPYWTPFIIGIFLTLVITMSPLIIAVYINRKVKTDIHIPEMLYLGFFYMGLITRVVMGFLPEWLPFVILFAMIVFFAVQWLYGKKNAVAGE